MNPSLPIEIFMTLLLSISAIGHALPLSGCSKEPPYLESMTKDFLSSPIDVHESVNNLPALNFGLPIAPDDIDSAFLNIIRLYFDGFQTCPSQPNATNPDLNHRSTCPHRWVTNFDNNRIPKLTTEVECACENCLEFSPDGRQTQNVCQPVYNHINALRRVGCDGEFYQYIRVVEKIKVACTCAHPHVQVSGGSNGNGPTVSP